MTACPKTWRWPRLNSPPHWHAEYVVIHEMVHLLEPTHSDRFVAILDEHWPQWREARQELNDLPLGAEAWHE